MIWPDRALRICDVSPRLEDTLTLAATPQALLRTLWRLRTRNLRWRRYDRFLIMENRWRAQRYGVSEGLIDFGAREIILMAMLAEELVEILAEDAHALGSTAEIARLPEIEAKGNAADRQRAVYRGYTEAGASHDAAMRGVVESFVAEFGEGA